MRGVNYTLDVDSGDGGSWPITEGGNPAKTYVRWAERPGGIIFELHHCESNSGTGYRYVKVAATGRQKLDKLLSKYPGPDTQTWTHYDDDIGDEVPDEKDTLVYFLDPERFAAFKDDLDAAGEYFQVDYWPENRDWELGKTFARWVERPDGSFQLQHYKRDNSGIVYKYYKKGSFIAVEWISGGWEQAAEVNEPLALNDIYWVYPDIATHKTITWTVKDAGGTGAKITKNVLTATAMGDATITGTVANGKAEGTPYTEDKTVRVKGALVAHGDFVVRPVVGGVELAQYLGNDTHLVVPDDLGITVLGPGSLHLSTIISVVVPAGVTAIDSGAFLEDYYLTSVTLPQTLRIIGGEAFNSCSALPSITIPPGVTTIGDWVFAGCNALSSVTVQGTVPPSVGDNFLSGLTSENLTIYVPAANVNAYKNADGWKKHADLITASP
jgi:hypothetical protein